MKRSKIVTTLAVCLLGGFSGTMYANTKEVPSIESENRIQQSPFKAHQRPVDFAIVPRLKEEGLSIDAIAVVLDEEDSLAGSLKVYDGNFDLLSESGLLVMGENTQEISLRITDEATQGSVYIVEYILIVHHQSEVKSSLHAQQVFIYDGDSFRQATDDEDPLSLAKENGE